MKRVLYGRELDDGKATEDMFFSVANAILESSSKSNHQVETGQSNIHTVAQGMLASRCGDAFGVVATTRD
jgi:hypothetical protein